MELAAAGSHTNGHWQASPCCLSCLQAGDALVAQTTPGGAPVRPTPARQALQRVSVPVVGVLVSDDPGTWKMQQHVNTQMDTANLPLVACPACRLEVHWQPRATQKDIPCFLHLQGRPHST